MKTVTVGTFCLSSTVLVIFYCSVFQLTYVQALVTPDPVMCECECEYYDKLQKWKEKAEEEKRLNITAEQKAEEAKNELKNTKQKLSVNTTTLSSNTRKYVSAKDDRTSAVGLGYMGAVFLGFMVTGIIACDLISIKQHVHAARTGNFAPNLNSKKRH
ncbi:uncharacterized protein [Argopecten irradians]|uniref:uncharacterized protein n=1 Tax=Argopecten irradians TaxID=31199 RepID=UPI00371658D0